MTDYIKAFLRILWRMLSYLQKLFVLSCSVLGRYPCKSYGMENSRMNFFHLGVYDKGI